MKTWDTLACRCCLVTKDKGIFSTETKLEKINDTYKRIYKAVTGLELLQEAGYPSYLCMECKSQLKKFLSFRRKCHRAFFVLKEIKIINKMVTYQDILTVDRKKANLETSHGYWKPQECGVYFLGSTKLDNENSEDDVQKMFGSIHSTGSVLKINIAPSEEINIEENVEPQVGEEGEHFDEETTPHDEVSEDQPNEPPLDIDLNDVFKGLEEEKSSESESEKEIWEDKQETEEPEESETKKLKEKSDFNRMRDKAKALAESTIRRLSESEQMLYYSQRLQSPRFLLATYKCEVCVTIFSSPESMQLHYYSKHDWSHQYECKICKDSLATEELLNQHMETTHLYAYTCKVCSKEFYTIKDIADHRGDCGKTQKRANTKPKKHKKKRELKKRLLIKFHDFFEEVPLKDYTRKEDAIRNVPLNCNRHFKCKICGFINVNVEAAAKHLLRHKNILKNMESYDNDLIVAKASAPIVNNNIQAGPNLNTIENSKEDNTKSLTDKVNADLNISNNNHADSKSIEDTSVNSNSNENTTNIKKYIIEERKGNDEICEESKEKGVKGSEDKNENVEGLGKDGNKERKCGICHAVCKSNQALAAHMRLKHQFDLQRYCGFCGHTYYTDYRLFLHQLQEHERIFVPEDNPQYECSNCHASFINGSALTTHIDTGVCFGTHRRCSTCDQYISMEEFKAHMEIHSPETVICHLCGEKVRHFSFGQHMKSHNRNKNEAQYKCKFCGEKIKQLERYCQHVLVQHTAKPYQCVACGNFFTYRHQVRDHILKTHTPGLIFECMFCTRRFSHEEYMADHCKKIHDVKINRKQTGKFSKKKIFNSSLVVYPLARIDLSLIEPEYLERIKLYMCDYKHDSMEPVDDYRHYMITPEDLEKKLDSTVAYLNNPPKLKKKKKAKKRVFPNLGGDIDETANKELGVAIKKKKSVDKTVSDNRERTSNDTRVVKDLSGSMKKKKKRIIDETPKTVENKKHNEFEAANENVITDTKLHDYKIEDIEDYKVVKNEDILPNILSNIEMFDNVKVTYGNVKTEDVKKLNFDVNNVKVNSNKKSDKFNIKEESSHLDTTDKTDIKIDLNNYVDSRNEMIETHGFDIENVVKSIDYTENIEETYLLDEEELEEVEETKCIGLFDGTTVNVDGKMYNVINQDSEQYIIKDGQMYKLEIE